MNLCIDNFIIRIDPVVCILVFILTIHKYEFKIGEYYAVIGMKSVGI